jgi:hypothetical protein
MSTCTGQFWVTFARGHTLDYHRAQRLLFSVSAGVDVASPVFLHPVSGNNFLLGRVESRQ